MCVEFNILYYYGLGTDLCKVTNLIQIHFHNEENLSPEFFEDK